MNSTGNKDMNRNRIQAKAQRMIYETAACRWDNADCRDEKKSSRMLFILLLLLVAVTLLHGCDKNVFFRDSPMVTKNIVLPHFNEISVNSIFRIELRNSPEFSISLTGPESILENVSYEVTGNGLEISDRNRYQWLPDYPVVDLVIAFPDLGKININSASSIFSPDTLHVAGLRITGMAQLAELDLTVNSGSIYLRTGTDNYGHYTFRGKAGYINLLVFGSAQVRARDLITERALVRNFSIADCHVYATDQLRAWLEHYGNIYYYGSPEEVILEAQESSGRLIRGTVDQDQHR
jgi:hypothetical protein